MLHYTELEQEPPPLALGGPPPPKGAWRRDLLPMAPPSAALPASSAWPPPSRPPPSPSYIAGWPSAGRIEYQGVSAIYRPGLPPVLRGLTFTIEGGVSCGVVGRTGSGKSSLLLTLFR